MSLCGRLLVPAGRWQRANPLADQVDIRGRHTDIGLRARIRAVEGEPRASSASSSGFVACGSTGSSSCTGCARGTLQSGFQETQEPQLFEVKFGFYPMQDRIVDASGLLELQQFPARHAHHFEFQA
jgi:hypothetical protein